MPHLAGQALGDVKVFGNYLAGDLVHEQICQLCLHQLRCAIAFL